MYGKCLGHEKCLINSHCGCGDNDDNDEKHAAAAADHDKGEEGERKWQVPVAGSFQMAPNDATLLAFICRPLPVSVGGA